MERPGTGASNLVNALLVIALFLLGIVLVSFLMFRKSLRRLVRIRTQPCHLDISSSIESKLEQLNRLPPSPITRVSFHDALQTQALTTAVDQYYRSASATMSGDGLNAVIQSIALTGGKLKLALRGADSILVAGLLYRRLPEHRRLCTRSTASHLLFAQVDRPQVTNQQPGSCQFS